MCCRYHLSQDHYRKALERLGVPAPAQFLSRYNIAPGAPIPAVRSSPRAAQREPAALRWGLVPSWARADEPGSRLVNARAETLVEKPSFRDALRARRCLIPATGFYEWETIGREKHPWYFRWRDDQPIGFAGLWETWRSPDGSDVESCAIVTTTPNALMRPIHHRMPVMLTPAQFDAWLDPRITDPAGLMPLLQTPPAEEMIATRVSDYVSSIQHEGPECLAPAITPITPQLSLGFE